MTTSITANQYPHKMNRIARLFRGVFSAAPLMGLVGRPSRPSGISVIMRVKDEMDWIEPSIVSIKTIADEIIIVDHGSTDGTYEVLDRIRSDEGNLIKLSRRPDLDFTALSNHVLEQTGYRWVLNWDGDMVAHTSGDNDIRQLRERVLSLDSRRFYVIYLRLINLAGDLLHQDSAEMMHIEEYIHTFSEKARFIYTGCFEAVRFPRYYRPLFWYEPYAFHINVKPARKMLLRYFWNAWLSLEDHHNYDGLDAFVGQHISHEFGTNSWEEAQRLCVERVCRNFVPYDSSKMGSYPDLLLPHVENSRYRLRFEDGRIVGRIE